MAEPLTSSDIWRIQRGFGVSELASPEEKKRFADAGVAPLTTGARQRFEEGRGISPMAGATEKEAWVAAEVMAGQRDPMDLPKAYGGLGERPKTPLGGFYSTGEETAYGRRQRRMQESWDAQYKMLIDQQEAAKKEEVAAKEMEMRTRDQSLQENEFYYNRGLKEAEQKLKAQQLSEATAIISGLNQLDPRDPEYQKKRSAIFGNNPFGAADPNVQKVATEYSAVNDVYSNAMKEQASGIKEAHDKYAIDMQSLMEAGVPEEDLPQYINPKSPVGLPMFDPLKVAAKLGTTKAEREAETRATKEETPKEKIGLDLQQAYGELNSLLLSGENEIAAASKVDGLRARYKAATGQDAPEVPFQPKSKEEYDRVPAGRPYIGQDGKTRIKQ